MGSREYVGRWAGGRVAQGRHGRTWIIEKMVRGERYTLALDVASEKEALAELALFRRDPKAYLASSQPSDEPEGVGIHPDLVARFLAHLEEKGRTPKYRRDCQHYLAAWAEVLGDATFQELELHHLKTALAKTKKARPQRIATLKSYCSFLREEGLLKSADDPTLELKVPQARAERAVRTKGYSMPTVQAHYGAVSVQAVRDVIVLRAKAGMHGSEIDRIATGACEVREVKGAEPIVATVRFIHKRGDVHTQSLDVQMFAAVQRLMARGSAPVDSYVRKALRAAAKELGLSSKEAIKPGELRHSFVDWAQTSGERFTPDGGGVPLADIGAAIGHKSAMTTNRFYNVSTVPPMIIVPVKLVHPDDPVPLVARKRRRGPKKSG